METTKSLASTIAALTHLYNPGPHVREAFARVLAADNACSLRRAAVLKHEDLREQLTLPPLEYPRADMWNGWVPPDWINVGEPELCRVNGTVLNKRGAYSAGEMRNDSPRRAALIEIVTEAWHRENALSDLPEPDPAHANPVLTKALRDHAERAGITGP